MDLRTRAIKSTGWYGGTRLTVQALSWAVTILVARLLTPGDYGLFAMALTVVTFLELFQEVGLGTALIQRQDLSRPQVNAVFWTVTAASLVLTMVLYGGAGLAARFYNEPQLVGIIRLLSLALLLNAFGIVPHNLLTKEIEFRRRSLAETAGAVVSALVTVVAAYHGHGVQALVTGYLTRVAVRTGALWLVGRWAPGLEVSFRDMRAVIRFGLHVTGASLVRNFSQVANRTIVGWVLGGPALGLYAVADAMATGPHRVSSGVIHQLSLPVFAKLQRDDERLRRGFLKISKYLVVAVLPVQVGMALVADDLVPVVLSDRWRPMTELFQALCLGGIFLVLSLPAAALLLARGKASRLFRFNLVYTAGMAAAVLVGAQFGLGGLAAAWLVVFPGFKVCLLTLGLAEIGIPAGPYLRNARSPVLATALMAVAVAAIQSLVPPEMMPVERLAVSVVAGAAVYVAGLWLVDRPFGSEVRGMVRELFASSRA